MRLTHQLLTLTKQCCHVYFLLGIKSQLPSESNGYTEESTGPVDYSYRPGQTKTEGLMFTRHGYAHSDQNIWAQCNAPVYSCRQVFTVTSQVAGTPDICMIDRERCFYAKTRLQIPAPPTPARSSLAHLCKIKFIH